MFCCCSAAGETCCCGQCPLDKGVKIIAFLGIVVSFILLLLSVPTAADIAIAEENITNDPNIAIGVILAAAGIVLEPYSTRFR
jgi:hypothetical protein